MQPFYNQRSAITQRAVNYMRSSIIGKYAEYCAVFIIYEKFRDVICRSLIALAATSGKLIFGRCLLHGTINIRLYYYSLGSRKIAPLCKFKLDPNHDRNNLLKRHYFKMQLGSEHCT
jgi:hypothetical protein